MCPKDHKTGSYSTLAHCTFDKPAFLLSEAPALCPFRLLAATARSLNSLWQRINLVSRVPWWWWGRPGLMLRESTCSAVSPARHSILLLMLALAVQPRDHVVPQDVTRSWLERLYIYGSLIELTSHFVREVSSLDAPQSKFLLLSLHKRIYNSTRTIMHMGLSLTKGIMPKSDATTITMSCDFWSKLRPCTISHEEKSSLVHSIPVQVLNENHSLRILDLKKNDITEQGALVLAEAPCSKNLIKIKLLHGNEDMKSEFVTWRLWGSATGSDSH